MKKSSLIIVFFVALILNGFTASLIKIPGYMDAEYYLGQGIQFYETRSFDEFFIWNYLNDPAGIPVAGFSFWLPLTSLIAAMGMFLFGSDAFFAARLIFILLAAIVPVITALVTYRLTSDKRTTLLASGLALFSGLFFPYATITDTFTPFMVCGGIFFLIILKIEKIPSGSQRKHFLLMGLVIGFMTLIRSEGVLWLGGGGLIILFRNMKKMTNLKGMLKDIFWLLLGFLIITIAWYIRNFQIYGSLYPPGNQLMLWLQRYDDLFVYPNTLINIGTWSDQGLKLILEQRGEALWKNLVLLVTAGGTIALIPLIAAGFWKLKSNSAIKAGFLLICITLFTMSFVFPFAGTRGGFFHSLSAFQVLLWGLAAAGLKVLIDWGIKKRNWEYDRAWGMFSKLVLLVAFSISCFSLFSKIEKGVEGTPWNETNQKHLAIEKSILELTGNKTGLVMVNNPPGYSLYTGRSSIMIPSGGSEAILAVCERYHVEFLVLDGERTEIETQLKNDLDLQEAFKLIYGNGNLKLYAYIQ